MMLEQQADRGDRFLFSLFRLSDAGKQYHPGSGKFVPWEKILDSLTGRNYLAPQMKKSTREDTIEEVNKKRLSSTSNNTDRFLRPDPNWIELLMATEEQKEGLSCHLCGSGLVPAKIKPGRAFPHDAGTTG